MAVRSGTNPMSSIAFLIRKKVPSEIRFSFQLSLIMAEITCLDVPVFSASSEVE
jgi:hypothetical protein